MLGTLLVIAFVLNGFIIDDSAAAADPSTEKNNRISTTTETTTKNSSDQNDSNDYYTKVNVKFPVGDVKSLPKWFKIRELIYISGAIGICFLLVVASLFWQKAPQNGRIYRNTVSSVEEDFESQNPILVILPADCAEEVTQAGSVNYNDGYEEEEGNME